jgi:hypothetical protein
MGNLDKAGNGTRITLIKRIVVDKYLCLSVASESSVFYFQRRNKNAQSAENVCKALESFVYYHYILINFQYG